MTKIKIVGGLIFIVSIVLAVLFNHISQQNRLNSGLLDVINEQKAFTQEISKNIFYINKNRDASTKQLDDSIKKFIERMKSKDKILDEIDSPHIKAKAVRSLFCGMSFISLYRTLEIRARQQQPTQILSSKRSLKIFITLI